MIQYKVEIPGFADIGTARSVAELVGILHDGQCIARMTVQKLSEIVDELEEEGLYYAKMANDDRLFFSIRKKEV